MKNVTLDVLKEIRNESRSANARLDQTNLRREELSRRIVESEVRTAMALTDLAGSVREGTAVLRAHYSASRPG